MQQDKNEVNVKKVTLLSLIPGMGQFANGQRFKGIVFIVIFLAFIIQMILGGFQSLIGLITCLLYTSDAADEEDSVDLGGRRIINKKNNKKKKNKTQ